MDFFYVTYQVHGDSSGIGRSYVSMGCLENYDIAEKYIVQYFFDFHQRIFIESMVTPDNNYEINEDYNETLRLITNDPRFYLLYKGVFSKSEFELFCKVKGNNKLNDSQICKFNLGKGSDEIYNHFIKLISGEGKYVYEYVISEVDTDEDSGRSYSMPVESGWRFRDVYVENDRIKERFNIK